MYLAEQSKHILKNQKISFCTRHKLKFFDVSAYNIRGDDMELKEINEILSILDALGINISSNKEDSDDSSCREVVFSGMTDEERERLSLI